MRFDARGSLELAVITATIIAYGVSMRFDARGSLEPAGFTDSDIARVMFLCALTREAPWNDEEKENDARVEFLCALTREAPWNAPSTRGSSWRSSFYAL